MIERKQMRVGQIMTREVITIGEHEDLLGVEEGMQRFGFSHLPVVEDGVLLGLVTHGDLLRASASSLEDGAHERDRQLKQSTFAYDIMKRGVATVGPDTALSRAARIMRDRRIGCLPVVGPGNRLVGILTDTDILKLAIRLLDERAADPEHAPPPFGARL